MIGVDENQTIKITITLGTLKKIIGVLSKDETTNLFLSNIKIQKDGISEEIHKARERMEKQYEKTKDRVLHKQEVKDRHALSRREKASRKMRIIKGDNNVKDTVE